MYENVYPDIDEVVMVQVRQIAEMGAYVNLLEYNNTEGMILLSELSRRRIRSVQKHIRVGRNEAVVVMRVDQDKGYIDLSKRRVSAEDLAKCEERYLKSKSVHSTLRYIADRNKLVLEDVYKQVGWPLYKKYGHAHDAFKLAMHDPETVLEGLFSDSADDQHLRKELISAIARKMAPQVVKIRADIEVSCLSYDGILGIKESIKAGQNISQTGAETLDIKVKLVAPPLFVVYVHTQDKAAGIQLLEKVIAEIDSTITQKFRGKCIVKMKPRVVSENEDMELAVLMEKFEKQNEDVSGDEDYTSSEGEEIVE